MPNNIRNDKGNCCWDRATKEHINRYCPLLDQMLDTINIPYCVRCNDCHCDLSKHKHRIVFCQSIIKCCLDVSKDCIPTAGVKTEKEMSEWSDQVAPEKIDLFYGTGYGVNLVGQILALIYDIMKGTRHQYNYAVRCCKKNKLKIQEEKLANNISHTKDFWKQLKK